MKNFVESNQVQANSNPFYYSQAAPGQDENPFLTDDLGGQAGEKRSKANVPPMRPPLPMKLRSQNASPARGEVKVQSKANLDDFFNVFETSTSNMACGVLSGQKQVAAIDLNSSQQHAFAPNTQKFSSRGEVVLNVDSKMPNIHGGG